MCTVEKPLFDAIVPIASGHQQGSAIITHRTNNTEAGSLVRKIRKSVAGWFFGYWTVIKQYRLEMVRKLMESFDVDAALLASLLVFPRSTPPHLL